MKYLILGAIMLSGCSAQYLKIANADSIECDMGNENKCWDSAKQYRELGKYEEERRVLEIACGSRKLLPACQRLWAYYEYGDQEANFAPHKLNAKLIGEIICKNYPQTPSCPSAQPVIEPAKTEAQKLAEEKMQQEADAKKKADDAEGQRIRERAERRMEEQRVAEEEASKKAQEEWEKKTKSWPKITYEQLARFMVDATYVIATNTARSSEKASRSSDIRTRAEALGGIGDVVGLMAANDICGVTIGIPQQTVFSNNATPQACFDLAVIALHPENIFYDGKIIKINPEFYKKIGLIKQTAASYRQQRKNACVPECLAQYVNATRDHCEAKCNQE